MGKMKDFYLKRVNENSTGERAGLFHEAVTGESQSYFHEVYRCSEPDNFYCPICDTYYPPEDLVS
jgi:hypothetical protein